MNKRLRKLGIILTIALCITLASIQGLSVLASNGGDIDGDFTTNNYNNRASIDNFNLLDANGPLESGESLSPNSSVTAQVTVNNPDTIGDLNSIQFFFYYDTTVATPSGALTLDLDSATNASGTQFLAAWSHTSEAIEVVSNGDDSSWSITAFTAPSISADYESLSFTFEFEFTVSKVANFTESEDWYFGTVMTDGRNSLESGVDGDAITDKGLVIGTGSSSTVSPSGFDMNFYGEIILGQTTLSWPSVEAGDSFASASNSAVVSGTKYIANNTYETNIKSPDSWDAVITQEVVDELLAGGDLDDNSDAFSAFDTSYNDFFSSKQIGNDINDLIGITYQEANQVIEAIKTDETDWAGIEFLLPTSSSGSNQTGASIITGSADEINTAGFKEQFFMIGYDQGDNGLNLDHTITESGKTYGILGSSGEWRPFLPDSMLSDGTQSQTNESGVTRDLTLYLYLSSIFQNAQYKGTISMQIINGN